MITVYIVDDHPYVREGLKAFFCTNNDIEVVGESATGEEAITNIAGIQPDVAVIDLHLPGIGGVELTRLIRQKSLATKVIILSSFCEDDEVISAIDAGALSYLMKDSPPQKLIEAVFAAKDGEPVLHSGIIKKLMKNIKKQNFMIEDLTSKEKEVLEKLAKGRSNKEIASELYISETTVKTHISSILRKLDVKDRTQAVLKAIEYKLVNV